MKLLLVGNAGGTNIGQSLWRAASQLGLDVRFCDARAAFAGPRLVRTLSWRFAGHRPPRLERFSREVIKACTEFRPRWLLTTGLAPLHKQALERVGELGVERINYLTDDPWNPSLRATWFHEALRLYDGVFSPRRSNMPDLAAHGCAGVSYLPFAFDPQLAFRESLSSQAERKRFASDVLFAGGADRDRVPFIGALIEAGLHVVLYGDYWNRFSRTRSCARGHATAEELRKAAAGAKVALCLVRKANRDGHVMRSFEIPASGTCILAEDTQEHREIFGDEGHAAVYFRAVDEMADKARWLREHEAERQRLARAAHQLIVGGKHTYRHRLETMLQLEQTHQACAGAA